MIDIQSFLLFTVLPSGALLAAIGLSLYEVYTVGERKLLIILPVLGFMFQHQILEWRTFWLTAQAVEPGFSEAFETGANITAAGSVYYILRFTRTQQELKEELESSRQQYRNLLSSSPVPILLHCPEQIRYVNDAAVDLFEAENAADIEGESLTTHLNDSLTIDDIIEPSDGINTRECTLTTLSGSQRTVIIAGAPAQYEGREATQLVVRDVTEQRRYSRELEAARDRLQKTFDNIKDGILLIDLDNERIIQCNASAASMLDYEREELLDLSPFDIHPHEPEKFSEFVQVVRAESETVTDQLSCRRKDGRLLPVEVAATQTTLDGRACLLVTLRDISERKRREQQITLLYRILRHNLRNDMTVVRGNATELEKQATDERERQMAERIISVADQLVETSDAVRQLNKMIEREHEQLRTTQDIVPLVQTVVAEYRDRYPNATLRADIPENVIIRGDETVAWAIQNLVENALTHTDTEVVTVWVSLNTDGTWATLTVEDDGPGIPQQERRVVTGESDRSPLEHGSGLGLWIVSQVATTFGGQFDLSDREGGGTVVRLQFRVATAETVTPDGTESVVENS